MTRLFSIVLFVFLTIFGAFFFVYLLMYSNSIYSYLLAFSYLALMLLSGFFNIFTAYAYYRSYFYVRYIEDVKRRLGGMSHMPSVGIVMSTFNEDTSIVKTNLERLFSVRYPKDKLVFYLLDDSSDAAKRKDMEDFCSRHSVRYIHRNERRAYKAGALNNMLKHSKEDLLAYFDYDEYLVDLDFVKDLVPYFSDEKLTYIQTEKRYARR